MGAAGVVVAGGALGTAAGMAGDATGKEVLACVTAAVCCAGLWVEGLITGIKLRLPETVTW
jgi:hypothetical protein